jgi:hypothetical protein
MSIGGLNGGPGKDVIYGGHGDDFVVGNFDGGSRISSMAVKASLTRRGTNKGLLIMCLGSALAARIVAYVMAYGD